MLSIVQALALSAVLTWLMLVTASLFRTEGWTSRGRRLAFGNRDDLPEPSALAGRADRAAKNMVENLAIFIALAAAVHFAGKASPQAQFGATLFFWARLIYWPTYLAGLIYIRTLVWGVSIAGLAMMLLALWA